MRWGNSKSKVVPNLQKRDKGVPNLQKRGIFLVEQTEKPRLRDVL